MRRWCAILLCVAGCGADEPQPPALEPPLPGADPGERGPYRVGVTTFETTDGEPDGRAFSVEVWYPTSAGPDAPVGSYAITAGELVLVELPSPNGTVRDGPLDLRGAPHPVVMLSHGFGGVRQVEVSVRNRTHSDGQS